MKVKSLVGLCKRNKSIFLYNSEEHDVQYMGDGCAVYPLFKMPKLNENNIFAVFDIPEKQNCGDIKKDRMVTVKGTLKRKTRFTPPV